MDQKDISTIPVQCSSWHIPGSVRYKQEGRADHLRVVEVKNDDLRFLVLADKCLDVAELEYKGMNLSLHQAGG